MSGSETLIYIQTQKKDCQIDSLLILIITNKTNYGAGGAGSGATNNSSKS